MTELEKAIAEVKRGNETFDQATLVLRAVVSGELIPATERDAAVAAALEDAAKLITFQIPALEAEYGPSDMMVEGMRSDADAILALITRPQADALARVRAVIGGVE